MSTTIIFRTYTGSQYELRKGADDCKGSPTILRHTPAEGAPMFGGRWFEVTDVEVTDEHGHPGHDDQALVFVLPGGRTWWTSPLETVEVCGFTIPVADTGVIRSSVGALARR